MKRRAMMNRRTNRLKAGLLLAAMAMPAAMQGQVILQYFEGKWETIERRMPDVFMAGYGSLWLPPAARADSGDQSVGFDVYDRFDLGTEGRPTLYGTEKGVLALIRQAKEAGIDIYFDTVYNHNGFSDGYRDDRSGQTGCQLNWAIGSGGYPGFIMSGRDIPDTPVNTPFDMEFRNVCPSAQFPLPSCDSDPLNCRISNLIDINHDTNFQYIRHPTQAGNVQNIPYQEGRVSAANARYYPDRNLPSPYDDGVFPFNLADPLAGDPGTENVNQMLQRYTQWMLEVNGIGGFRLDAVKHTPAGWYNNIYDFAAKSRGRDAWGRPRTPFSFGEFVSGSWDELRPHHRRDGYGNRTVLDFPLKFGLQNSIGTANFGSIIGASADGLDDGNTQNGTAGVQFVQSHDNGFIGDPPGLQNMAYAHILTRKGRPIVYYNSREMSETLGNRDFPNQNNRGDALGLYGPTITNLVHIYNNFVARRNRNLAEPWVHTNPFAQLWADGDYVAYEHNNNLLVGMTDRFDRGSANLGYEERTITLAGYRSVRLKEVSGNATDAAVDPNDTIRDFIDVPADGRVAFRVPTDKNANNVGHGKPYVVYAVEPPQGATLAVPGSQGHQDIGLTVTNVDPNVRLTPDADTVPEGRRRLTRVDVLKGNSAEVLLKLEGGSIEDNALIKWNYGINIDGSNSGPISTPGAPGYGISLGIDDPLLAGYENFTAESSPRFGGGTGTYRVTVDLTNPQINEGYHYITAIAFVQRDPSSLPPIFNTFRKVVYVDRRGPDAQVAFPASPDGVGDIGSSTYGFVIDNPDRTANAVHYFWNLPEGTNPISAGLLNDGNRAQRADRNRFRFSLNNLQTGPNQRLTLVLFEETGNSTVQTFNIGVDLGVPPGPSSFLVY